MIVAMHPPQLLPWLGVLDRMARADLFVVVDHVPFERVAGRQVGVPSCHRARYLLDGVPRWLTVPLLHRSPHERVADREVDHGASAVNRLARADWGRAGFESLQHAYRDAGFFPQHAAPVRALLEARWTRFADLALASMELLREAFAVRTPMIRSSELGVRGGADELVLEVCRAAGARTYLAGSGGSRFGADAGVLERAGIRVERRAFHHPVHVQCGNAPFVPGLSAIDALFNCGPLAARLLRSEPLKAAA
ncbi:MAG TPA: WbqC family protein [Burkholderiales bacterium]|nr:WbqC family protein [Burkholderiales bacterium]